MSRIPIVLIAGFLGAGKTTFLHALMGALKERQVGFSVVVNDFENAEIDAARLRDLDVEVQSINGSCVCCSSLNDFMLTLGTIDVPRGGVLLVEANGASDFITLIAAISMRGECRRFTSPIQVTMIDTVRWQKRRQHNKLEQEQVKTATHWMLTHTDGVKNPRLAGIRAAVKMLTPRGIETSVDAFADFLRLQAATARFVAAEAPKPALFENITTEPAHEHHHHHDDERAFTSMRVPVPFVVQRQDLERVLRHLPDEVLRVKGLCRLAELPQIPFSFQHVRPEGETWFLPMLGTLGVIPIGVVIGVGLPEKIIQNAFEALPSAELRPDIQVEAA
ncbi:MAG: GTP-binding protein [Verrucomicrobiaceae bacterium]|nr:GTP-binding protein [Verrucomicrobiaceae bacterium]